MEYDRSLTHLLNKDCKPLRVECIICNEIFNTRLVVKDNKPYDSKLKDVISSCCSIKCYNK